MPNTRRPAAVVVSLCAPWPASTRRPTTPRVGRSCTVLTRRARFRPSRSSARSACTQYTSSRVSNSSGRSVSDSSSKVPRRPRRGAAKSPATGGQPSNPRLRGRGALAIDQTPPRGPASPELVAGSHESRAARVALGPRSGRSLEGTAGAPPPTTSPAGVLGRPQIDDNLLEWLVRSRPRRSRGGVPRWSTGAPRATGSGPLVSVGTAGRRDFDPRTRVPALS